MQCLVSKFEEVLERHSAQWTTALEREQMLLFVTCLRGRAKFDELFGPLTAHGRETITKRIFQPTFLTLRPPAFA